MPSPTHYIDGRFVPAHSARLIDVIDPSTQEVIGQVSDGDEHDVNAAVAAARRAFDAGPWGGYKQSGIGRELGTRRRNEARRAETGRSLRAIFPRSPFPPAQNQVS